MFHRGYGKIFRGSVAAFGAALFGVCCPPPAQAPCPQDGSPDAKALPAPSAPAPALAVMAQVDALKHVSAAKRLPRLAPMSLGDVFVKRGGHRSSNVIDLIDWTPSIPPQQVTPGARRPEEAMLALLQARAGSSVGYLSVPGGPGKDDDKRCVAWLVLDDVVVTSTHCVKDADEAEGVEVTFDYYSDVSADDLTWHSCGKIKQVWAEVDVTALQCDPVDGRSPGSRYGKLALATEDPKLDEPVYVLHQNCNYYSDPWCDPTKLSSPGKVTNEPDVKPHEFSHTADTLEGSSGAPVISAKSHAVVGLHHAGCSAKNDCGKTTEDGKGHHNLAVRVSTLRKLLGPFLPPTTPPVTLRPGVP